MSKKYTKEEENILYANYPVVGLNGIK